MTLDSWKRIVLDPCNRSAQRRNEAATRDAFEEIVNYITNNNTTITGDGTIVFFEVTTTSIGSATTTAVEIVTPGFTATGRTFTLYDYTSDLRFAQNFVDGYLGCGRLSEDIAADAVVVIELEGKARYIDGNLTANMVAGSATADVTNYWGAYPNIHTPGASVTVQDRNNFAPNAKNGDYYLAVWDEQEQEYVVVMIDDHELIMFKVDAAQTLGAQSAQVTELLVVDGVPPTFTTTGRTMTAYDPTWTGTVGVQPRFAQNFVEGYRGVGRHAPEIDNDSLVIIELEGKARFISGTLNANLTGASVACTVTDYWGAYPNSANPGTPVTVYDRSGYANGASSGAKFLAVWDEDEQEYVFVLPVICSCTVSGETEFVKMCDEIANECCLYDALIWRVKEETTDFCNPDICIKPIWLYCYQGVKEGDEWPIPIVGGADQWCGMATFIKADHACGEDTRDVYGVDCGDCSCPCPDPLLFETASVIIPANACLGEISFIANCVADNPMANNTPATPGWWGEFSIEGYYPMVALNVTVEDFTFMGETIDNVFVVIGCNGHNDAVDLTEICEATLTYVEIDGEYVEYTGNFTLTDPPSWAGTYTPIVQDGCLLYCQRTFHYGMFLECSSGAFTGTAIYHLFPEGSITRIAGGCDAIDTPSEGEFFDDSQSITAVGQAPCCVTRTTMQTSDYYFGYSYSCEVTITKDLALPTHTAGPMTYHVFGGCKTIISGLPGGADLDPCIAGASNDAITFYVNWGARKIDDCVD